MRDLEEELRKAEERNRIIVDESKTKTIYEVDFPPFIKRNLVDRVPSDSEYKKSFDEYLKKLADLISENLQDVALHFNRVTLSNRVMDLHVMLHLINSSELYDITLNGPDHDKIVDMVYENLIKRF